MFIILAALAGLRQTLGRCRIRTEHTLRIVAYAAAPLAVLIVVCIHLAVFVAAVAETVPDPYATALAVVVLFFATIVPMVLTRAYLVAGLREYLRLPRAGVVATVTAFVGLIGWVATLALTSRP